MVKEINYKGSIFSQIERAITENPTMTVGEILYSVVRKQNTKGKHFFYMTDQEMYEALERFNTIQEDKDEPLNEQEFDFWIAQKQIIG